jgi:hypothetical protein
MSESVDWSDVHGGDVVAGGGKEWVITTADHMKRVFTLSHPTQTWTGVRTGTVELVSRRPPQADPRVTEATAKGLIATKFGGIEIGKRDKAKPYATPVTFMDPGSMLAHLRIFHAQMSDDPSLAGLEKEHAALHRPEHRVSDMFEPHVHDPDYESL